MVGRRPASCGQTISREKRNQGEPLRFNWLVSAENGSTDFRENSISESTGVRNSVFTCTISALLKRMESYGATSLLHERRSGHEELSLRIVAAVVLDEDF